MGTFVRTATTPKSFDLQPSGRSQLLDKIYVGFVKAVEDDQKMGRLKVWIPEINGNASDSNGWLTVVYASPFAGATNPYANTNGNQYLDSQRSYGMWFVPPDVENEVLCCFINGDPARGVWFACLWQQYMNHMVPGLAGNNANPSLPVGEYNKQVNQDPKNPTRPSYTPLADALVKQGLQDDKIRGVSNSSARRTQPANSVAGILTPGGSQFVLDDDPNNKFIRLRTESGTQVMLNDNTGEIYMISRDGNNWVSMNASGEIDIYAYKDVSIRTQGSLNLRADLDVNIEAGRSIFMKARNDPDTPLGGFGGGLIKMNANVALHMSSDGDMFQSSKGMMNRTSDQDIKDTAQQDFDIKAGNSVYIQADGGDVDIKANAETHVTSTNIHLNSVAAGDASAATAASLPSDLTLTDASTVNGQVSQIQRKTLMYRLPYHEPYNHAASIAGLNGQIETVNVKTDPNTQLVRDGEVIKNTNPLDIIGTPKSGMQPGVYKAKGYDDNGNPIYEYQGGSSDLGASASYSISSSGRAFIQRYEAKSNTKYPDPKGQTSIYSIGWGHRLTANELAGNYVIINGKQVVIDRALTDAECDTLFAQDLAPVENDVRKAITTKITQTQFDMLCSFRYNTGKMAGTDLAKAINDGNFSKVPAGFMQYIRANGQVLNGLISRRQAEASKFMNGVQTNI